MSLNLINNQILSIYPKIEKLSGINSIIKGYVQSGKTHFELCMIWRSIYILERFTILILGNNINSLLQVQERDIPEFNSWISNLLGNKDTSQHIKIGIDNLFLISLSNPSRLKEIQMIITDKNFSYDLIVDEADTSIKDIEILQHKTKTGFIFDELAANSSTYCQVTATPFANLNKKDHFAISYKLPKPENYRGINDVKWWNCKKDLRKSNNMEDLLKIVSESINTCKKCPSGYKSILVNASQARKIQKLQSQEIKKRFPDIKVYVINTDNATSEIKEVDQKGQYIRTFIFSIQQLYALFEKYKWDNIIVSCFKASRANSYRPLRTIGNGGLTGMIYIPTKTSHCSQLIQAMRIFGVYDKSYPIINLWTPANAYFRIKKETINIDILTEATCTEICDTRNTINGIEILVTGRHDRKDIDDTIIEKSYNLFNKEYDSLEDAERYIMFPYNQKRCMNHKPQFINIGVKNIASIRRHLRNMDNDPNRIRIASNWSYYNKLFDLNFRYIYDKHPSDIIAGTPNKLNHNIPFVRWYNEYCDKDLNLNNLFYNCLYWYWTTTGKIRIWMKIYSNTRVGTLRHNSS